MGAPAAAALLPLAIDRAIFENLPALSERASSVACNTTAELILKVLPRREGSRLSPSVQRAGLPSDVLPWKWLCLCSAACHVVLSSTKPVRLVALCQTQRERPCVNFSMRHCP